MKLLSINDLHLASKNPVSRVDDYTSAILQKLDQVLLLGTKIQATAILIAGDVFHEKQPQRVAHGLVVRMIQWLLKARAAGIEVLAIPGNHDISNDRYETVPYQPIGVLFRSGLMHDVSFINFQLSAFVSIAGIPYPHAKAFVNYQQLPKPETPKSILMAHCFANAAGGTYYGEPIMSYPELSTLPYDGFVFGHDHNDNGVMIVEKKPFINIGALSRGSLSKENIQREVKCAIIDVGETVSVTQVRLQVTPSKDCFDLKLRAQKERESREIEEFVGQLNTDDVGTLDYNKVIDSLELTDKVRKRTLEYISNAELETQE